MKRIVHYALALAWVTGHAFAAERLTAAQVDGVLMKLEAGMNDYVFPDRAQQVREYLQAHAAEYRTIRSQQQLAERLTADLRAVGNDKHLTVRYLPPVDAAAPMGPDHWHTFGMSTGFGIEQVSRLPGNIAYLRVDYFADDPDVAAVVAAAFRLVDGGDALILDLRKNHGGSPMMVDALLSHLYRNRTQLTSIVWREGNKRREEEQWTDPAAKPAFLDKPVYVLDSSATFSGGEQCAYDLKATQRAVIVGEPTGGGANPANRPHDLGQDLDAFIPNGEAVNPITKTNWEGSGVQPDVQTPAHEALLTAYTLALSAAKPGIHDARLIEEKEAAQKDPGKALRNAGVAAGDASETP